jgi:putative inorganic carbon (HCO3(-)) transporter
MLTALKEFLRWILAPSLYATVFLTFLVSTVKRAEWAVYLLAILAPLPVLWYQLHQFPMGKDTMDILIFGALLGIFVNKGGFDRAPGTFLVISFMLASYVAVWNITLRYHLPMPFTTANPVLADWKNYVEMIFLYFIAFSAIKTEDQQKTMLVIMATVILLIAVREFRNFTAGDIFAYDKRAEGPFWIVGLGANHLGAFIADYAGLLLGMFLIDKHKYRKWLYLAAVLFSIHPMFFSYSRGAYIAMLAVIVVYGLIKKRSLLVLVAALVFTWQVILPPSVVDRIEMTETTSGELEESAADRVILWEHAKQLFEENPVFGIGFNGFPFTLQGQRLTDTHNFYMKTASEQGVIGLLLLGLVLLRALTSGWRLYRGGQSAFHQGLGLGFVGCVTALVVTNIFGDRFSYFALGSYFWLLWGVVERAVVLTHEAPAPVTDAEPDTDQASQTASE